MIDTETAHHGARLLATAIGEIMEDASPEALRPSLPIAKETLRLAADLELVGADIAALASAMAVLIRRSGTADLNRPGFAGG